MSQKPPRAWQRMLSGHAFSVAEHSVIVESLLLHIKPKATAAERLTALLHDAAEYVIGDMISPFKQALGLDYKTFETRLEEAIHLRFGLPAQIPSNLKKQIKQCDLYCAWFEATQIAGFDPVEADTYFHTPPKGMNVSLSPLSVTQAERAFLNRFEQLNMI